MIGTFLHLLTLSLLLAVSAGNEQAILPALVFTWGVAIIHILLGFANVKLVVAENIKPNPIFSGIISIVVLSMVAILFYMNWVWVGSFMTIGLLSSAVYRVRVSQEYNALSKISTTR